MTLKSSNDNLRPIKGVLFDMDGLLIDTENIYTTVANKILSPFGKEQTWEIKSKIMGRHERKSTEILLSCLWPPSEREKELGNSFSSDCPISIDTFIQKRNSLIEDEFRKVQPLPGAIRLVQHLSKHNIPICVATGSTRRMYGIKSSNNQELFKPFGERIICSDDERLKRGKPFPDIFLLAAREGLGMREGIRELGEENDETFKGNESQFLIFEDATLGVQAAKAAGMKVVWVPDPRLVALLKNTSQQQQEEIQPDQTISTLEHFKPEQWGLPPFDDNVI